MIATIAELDRIRDECRTMVTKRSLMSAGAAVVPVPGADVVADVGLLSNLLPAISTRFELDEAQVNELRQALRTRVGRDVSIDLRVDPSLLGGLVVKIGSQMIDSSIKTRLNTLAHAMKG